MMPTRKYNNQNWLPSIFNDFFDNEWLTRANATAPAINVIESDKDYKVEVAAPGMTKEDFNIHISENNELVISMEKKNETKDDDHNIHDRMYFSEFTGCCFDEYECQNTGRDTAGDRACKHSEHNHDKRSEGFCKICEINILKAADHQKANENQSRSGCRIGNHQHQRREKYHNHKDNN